MAVPKKKISKSKGGLRRGGNGGHKAVFPNVVENKETGEFQLSHNMTKSGQYGKKNVLEETTADTKADAKADKKAEEKEDKAEA